MRAPRLLPSSLWTLALLPALVTGCGDDPSPAADSSTTEAVDSSSTAPSESSESSSSTGVPDDWPFDHGYVMLRFVVPASAPNQAILDDTVTVVVTMHYGQCLDEYYEANPDLQQFGELGGPIFGDSSMGGEGWEELLCSPLFGDHAQCTIVWITQRFDAVRSLTVTYDTMAELGTKPLFFGPLPTAAVAQCADGLQPTVAATGPMAFRGIDSTGADLWIASAWAPAESASRDQEPLMITIEPM